MFLLTTAAGRKLLYIILLLKGQQDAPYRAHWLLSQEDSSSWDQFTIKLSAGGQLPAEPHFGKAAQLPGQQRQWQGTASPTPVPPVLWFSHLWQREFFGSKSLWSLESELRKGERTGRIDTTNSHPSAAKQLKALPEILPTPRFPHVARAAPVRVTIYISNPPSTSADAQL